MESVITTQSVPRFTNRWGTLRQTRLPVSLVQDGVLTLASDALSVYTCLLYSQKGQRVRYKKDKRVSIPAEASVSQLVLQQRTGYSEPTVRKAIGTLRESGLIDILVSTGMVRKKGKPVSTYTFLDPRSVERTTLFMSDGNLLYSNGIPYFGLPSILINQPKERWSMASVKGSPFRLYVAIVYLANRVNRNEFKTTRTILQKLSGLDRRTFATAMAKLNDVGLVWDSGVPDLSIEICDPYTGLALEPECLYEEDDDGVFRRLKLDWTLTPAQVEETLRQSLGPDAWVIEKGSDRFILCPFHPEKTPSCSVSTVKRGAFHCFGCHAKSDFRTLLVRLKEIHGNASITATVATAQGKQVRTYHPDSEADIFDYRTANGTPRKQVLKYRDAPPGERYRQRKKNARGEWEWYVGDLGVMLYNLDRLWETSVVAIVEGERDADTVTNLDIRTPHGTLVGVTSGGATSWHDKLADHLIGKRVVLIPDQDTAGARYAEAVATSLAGRGIQYAVVSLAGTGCKDISEYMEMGHTVDDVRALLPSWCTRKDDPPELVTDPLVTRRSKLPEVHSLEEAITI